MVTLGKFYEWCWFHTEFWLTPIDRRPYTFIMRDWIYYHLNIFASLVTLFYMGMIVFSFWNGVIATVVTGLASLLIAHLVWGSKWIEGEQEFPEYLGG